MKNKEDNDNKKNYLIIALALIIIILLLFCHFGKIGKDNLIPTGNVDVFDIDIYCKHKKINKNNDNIEDTNTISTANNTNVISRKTNNNKSRNTNTNTHTNTNIDYDDSNTSTNSTTDYTDGNEYIHTDKNDVEIPPYNEETDNYITGEIFVDDKNGNYIYQEKLRIFTNAAYNFTNKIAPGVSNVYQFVVHNSYNGDINYYIEMYEETEYKINMKYRLKLGNQYVIGNENNWVSAEDLVTNFKYLRKSASDQYSLEWKWFDDNQNDTIAGTNMENLYKLNIRFYFEAVNG